MKSKNETSGSEPKLTSKGWKKPFVRRREQVKVEELSSEDVVIGVMGPTGSGKSSFIEIATGFKGIVGHTLKSCTTEISVIRFSVPEILDCDICLVDTPGFDDTNRSDVDIFKMISEWLNNTYRRHIQLAGLLYFHRITDNRMAGTPLKNLRLFEKLCGKEFSKIVLTTTMWDDVELEIGTLREGELQEIYWKSMVDRGSTVKRFLSTPESAFDVLRPILAPILTRVDECRSLLLQKEMVDLGLKLKETAAGRVLAVQLEELVPRQHQLLMAIRDDLTEAKSSPEQLAKLMQDYQEVSAQLQRVIEDIERMKISVGERFLNIVKVKNLKGIWSMFWKKKQGQVLPSAVISQTEANNSHEFANHELDHKAAEMVPVQGLAATDRDGIAENAQLQFNSCNEQTTDADGHSQHNIGGTVYDEPRALVIQTPHTETEHIPIPSPCISDQRQPAEHIVPRATHDVPSVDDDSCVAQPANGEGATVINANQRAQTVKGHVQASIARSNELDDEQVLSQKKIVPVSVKRGTQEGEMPPAAQGLDSKHEYSDAGSDGDQRRYLFPQKKRVGLKVQSGAESRGLWDRIRRGSERGPSLTPTSERNVDRRAKERLTEVDVSAPIFSVS